MAADLAGDEGLALSITGVAQAYSDAGILYLKGDWTHRDPTRLVMTVSSNRMSYTRRGPDYFRGD